MFARVALSVEGAGLGYACTLLQLHLGLGYVIGIVTLGVGTIPQLRKQLADVPWQAALRADAAAARPALLLVVFALVQVRAEAMGLVTMVGLIVAAFSVFVTTFLVMLVPLCGGQVPEVSVETGDINSKTIEIGVWLARVVQFLRILKACGQLPLLVATLPGGVQLAIASAIIRLALTAEVLGTIATTIGFAESALAEACADAAKVLQFAPLLGGLVIMDHMAWGAASILSLPFQPSLYCALGLAAQVALILVLHFGCRGGLQVGCAACDRVDKLNRLAGAGICLGLLGCIVSVFMGTCELTLSQSGVSFQWGQLTSLNALILAQLTFFTQVLTTFAPEPLENTSEGAVQDAADGEDHEAAEPLQLTSPGISEPMQVITSRAPGIILALVAMHMGAAEASDSGGFLNNLAATFSVPFRAGFPLCVAAMVLQVFLLFIFTAYHCEDVPVPEPPMDGTGTLQWEPESETWRKMSEHLRNVTLLLLQVGLLLGILGLGLLPWLVIKIVLFLFVFPLLPQQGKSNIYKAIGWLAFGLKSLGGVFGDRLEAYLQARRAIAEAEASAAAEQAAASFAADEAPVRNKKTSDMDDGAFKQKTFNSSPKKARGSIGGSKKKKTM